MGDIRDDPARRAEINGMHLYEVLTLEEARDNAARWQAEREDKLA